MADRPPKSRQKVPKKPPKGCWKATKSSRKPAESHKTPNNLITHNKRDPNKRAPKYFFQRPFGRNELRYSFSFGHAAILGQKRWRHCSFHYKIAVPLHSVMRGGGRENIFLTALQCLVVIMLFKKVFDLMHFHYFAHQYNLLYKKFLQVFQD